MATLTRKKNRHGNDYWELQYYQGGKQHRDSLGPCDRITPHDAKIKLQAKELELSTGEVIFTGGQRFAVLAQDYLTWHAGEFPTSAARVASIVKCALLPTFGDKVLARITQKDVDAWKAARRKAHPLVRDPKNGPQAVREVRSKTLTESSVAKELTTLKAIFNKGIEWKMLKESPARHVSKPQPLTDEVQRFYTRPQLALLYKQPLHGAHWQFIAGCGLRRTEFMNLTHAQVLVGQREMRVESRPTGRTKSRKKRIIPMTDTCLSAYRRIEKAARLSYRKEHGRLPSADAFGALYVLPRMTGHSWSRAFKRDRDRLGLPAVKGSLVHMLRHSYGSHATGGEVPIRTLQKLLGHASVVTTMRYAHTAPAHLHEQSRKIKL